MEDTLEKILRSWAADREGVSILDISEIKHDLDEGWPGTEVTPGDPPEIIVNYTVTKKIVYRRRSSELGAFIVELGKIATRGPL